MKFTNFGFPANTQMFAEDTGAGSGTASNKTTETGTAVSTASTNVENGAQTTAPQAETKPFKSFATQADFDREIQQTLKSREESLKAKLTPEIKAQLDKESKMTAEQKVQAQLDDLNNQKSELAKERCRLKTESLLISKGITDEVTRSTMLDSVVTVDETESLKRAQALVDAIEKATNEKIKEAMKKVKSPDSNDSPNSNGKSAAINFAKNYAKRHAEESKTSSGILKKYINGQ